VDFLHVEKCRTLQEWCKLFSLFIRVQQYKKMSFLCHLSLLPQFGSKRAEILHTDSLNKCTRVCQWARWCMFGCLPRLTQLGTTISQPQTKFLKSLLCNFLALLWVAFTQHFSPLASKLRKGFYVAETQHMYGRRMTFQISNSTFARLFQIIQFRLIQC